MKATSTGPREAATQVLDAARVPYQVLVHEHTETARAEAIALGVPPEDVAKTVVLVGPHGHVRAVVPSNAHVRLRKAAELVGAEEPLRLASEHEIALRYPEFEVGAVPPFGGAQRDQVLVDRSLTERESIIVEAGTHEVSLRLDAHTLVGVCGATVGDIASFRPLPPPPAGR